MKKYEKINLMLSPIFLVPVIYSSTSISSADILEYGIVETPFGNCLIGTIEHAICTLQFCDDNEKALVFQLKKTWKNCIIKKGNLSSLQKLANTIFRTSTKEENIFLYLHGTSFQLKVWKTLLTIPFGITLSYSELAKIMGNTKAIRAVASAIARNDIGYLIPCHRIIHKNGNLGQYRWGTDRKSRMQKWEKEELQKR